MFHFTPPRRELLRTLRVTHGRVVLAELVRRQRSITKYHRSQIRVVVSRRLKRFGIKSMRKREITSTHRVVPSVTKRCSRRPLIHRGYRRLPRLPPRLSLVPVSPRSPSPSLRLHRARPSTPFSPDSLALDSSRPRPHPHASFSRARRRSVGRRVRDRVKGVSLASSVTLMLI